MVDLPESMKTGGFDPQKAQADLAGVRNRARKDEREGINFGQMIRDEAAKNRQIKNAPIVMPRASSNQNQPTSQSQPWSYETDALTQAERQATALDQARAQARNQQKKPLTPQQQAKLEKKEKRQKEKQAKLDELSIEKDYPIPITLREFQLFMSVAMFQDVAPLVCDLIGIGWIVEYCLLPFTWLMYWYLIIRRAPRSMRRKFWQRTLMLTVVGWIPVVGQFIPEWIATALGAYIVISMYERRKSYQAAGKRSNEARGAGKPSAEPAKAAA